MLALSSRLMVGGEMFHVLDRAGTWRITYMQLLLSDDETVLLRDLLADYLPALEREVARTEQHDLRHLMVQRQDLVERLLEQLSEQTT
jgi:hypothetical protein